VKEYQEEGRNGELYVWKEGYASLHDMMITGDDGAILVISDTLKGKCYVVDDIPGCITHHWIIDFDMIHDIPDDAWLELKRQCKKLHFRTTVERMD
jgi:hypothetical protein